MKRPRQQLGEVVECQAGEILPVRARADSTPKPFAVNRDGFSVNCAVSCQAHQHDRLERLCRYIARPALCLERPSIDVAGQVGSSNSELLN